MVAEPSCDAVVLYIYPGFVYVLVHFYISYSIIIIFVFKIPSAVEELY